MHLTLHSYLDAWANSDPARVNLAATVRAIAAASGRLSNVLARGTGGRANVGGRNASGDAQTELDLRAHELMVNALSGAPVAVVGSEEHDAPILLRPSAPLAVAIDPLDGSSNIETNVSMGTIFAILPATSSEPSASLLQPGAAQLAAGFAIYGPQTALVLTLGEGVAIFVLGCDREGYLLAADTVHIPEGRREYAINGSNHRHWDGAIRAYVEDCNRGADGPRGADFNTRWLASVVAEAYRILARGGVYLYPRDARPSYRNGRLRLVYEANPLAFIIEQAGGAATTGTARILDLQPTGLHQHVPLIFGAADEVVRIVGYCTGARPAESPSPLFGARGLFRAEARVTVPCP